MHAPPKTIAFGGAKPTFPFRFVEGNLADVLAVFYGVGGADTAVEVAEQVNARRAA